MILCQASMAVRSAIWLMRQQHVSSIYLFQKKMHWIYHWQSFALPRLYWSLTISSTVFELSHICILTRLIFKQNMSVCLPSSKICSNVFINHLIYQKSRHINTDQRHCRVNSNRTPVEFESMVCKAQEYIRAGDIFQVVLSQRLSRHVNAAPFTIYRALRSINPSPYMFFLDLQDIHIIGASPELLVRVEDGEVTIHPIAGTRRRVKIHKAINNSLTN